MNSISTIHRAQGLGAVQRLSVPLGLNVEEMAMLTHNTVEGLVAFIRAPAGYHQEWVELARDKWKVIKPKLDGVLMFGYRIHGGGSSNIFKVVLSVALAVVLPGIGSAIGAAAGSAFVGGLAAAAIGIGASLALNALFPAATSSSFSAPAFLGGTLGGEIGSSSGGIGSGDVGGAVSIERPEERAKQFSNVKSDSNLLAKESYLPIVVGSRRISPPEIASPFFHLDRGIQSIDRIFGLDGHHELSDIQVDNAPISDFGAITTEIKDGAETSSVSTFVDKITNLTAINEALSTFSLDSSTLVDQSDPENSSPRWSRFVTFADDGLEEISIRLRLDSFIKTDDATAFVITPIRMRFRQKGSTGAWFNIPEIHLFGREISTLLKEIRIRWDSDYGDADVYHNASIQYHFYHRVPDTGFPLSDGTTGSQWQAHAHFISGSGIRDVVNISGRRNGFRITLDESLFPKQNYEWEISRGISVNLSDFAVNSYQLSAQVESLFAAKYPVSSWVVPVNQGAYVGRLTVSHVTSIVNEVPCQRPKTALIALKAIGQSVKNVTVLASRYVYDWDGSGWNTLTTTSNPATQYRQVLVDYLNYNGIDTDLISNTDFVNWRQECIDEGYEVSATYAGLAIRDVLASIATAGFARPRYSEGFGVDWFRDRSSERPVQSFSPRNATISLEWIHGEKPVGIRAKFQNEDDAFREAEIQINNPFYTNFSGYDVRSYDMIASPILLKKRVYFDLLQAFHQGRRAWIVEASIEGLICERGDMVGIVTDLTNDTNSGARIRTVLDASNFTIDQEIPSEDTENIFDVTNIFDPSNAFNVGAESVCLISTPSGTELHSIVAAETTVDGNLIRISSTLSSTDVEGAHIVIGPVSDFTNRCIVSEVKRTGEERAQLICVDEAPEIFEQMQERFS